MSYWSQLAPQDEELHCLVWPENLQILGSLIFTRPIPQNLEVFGNPEIFRAVCGSLFFRNPETLFISPKVDSQVRWDEENPQYESIPWSAAPPCRALLVLVQYCHVQITRMKAKDTGTTYVLLKVNDLIDTVAGNPTKRKTFTTWWGYALD